MFTHRSVRRQLGYMIARQQVLIDLEDPPQEYSDDIIPEDEREVLAQIMSNVRVCVWREGGKRKKKDYISYALGVTVVLEFTNSSVLSFFLCFLVAYSLVHAERVERTLSQSGARA